MGTHHHYTVVRQISTLSYGFRETQRYQCRETHSQTLGWHLQRRYSTAHLPVQMPTTAYPKMSTFLPTGTSPKQSHWSSENNDTVREQRHHSIRRGHL